MKFVVAQLKHETHTFVPDPTPLARFNAMGGAHPLVGEEALVAFRERNCCISAFIQILEEQGHQCQVALAGEAMPSGPVEDDAFEWMCDQILKTVDQGCDAVLLDLHGSMVTQSLDDGEGELLTRIRKARPDIPIAIALDFHATLTPAMVSHCDIITLYRTLPHVDMFETGARATRLLLEKLQGNSRPHTAVIRLPMMASLECMDPQAPPLKAIWDQLLELEKKPGILSVDLSCAHPFTDVGPGGMAVVVIGDEKLDIAEKGGRDIAAALWEKRRELVLEVEPHGKTLERALALEQGPVIIADSGDIPASGGFAADMTVLKAAMDMGAQDMIAGPFHDARAVETLVQAGVGQMTTLDIGGRTHAPLLNYQSEPLRVTGRVRAIVDGRITATGPMLKGLQVSIGTMAVITVGTVDILVTEQRIEALDVAVFTHVGLDPTHRKFTLLKSRQHFRAAFEPIARHVVRVAGPGVTHPDFSAFPFKHIQRPLFPLDKDAEFNLTNLHPAG